MEFYWLEKRIIFPVRRLCRRLVSRIGFRKQGILILSREVQACEYEDVQIMWEMLKKTDTSEVSRSPTSLKLKNRSFLNTFTWAKWGTCLRTKF